MADTAPHRLSLVRFRADYVLVGLLFVLTFLLGSFAIRNPDFLTHLATGRLLAQGDYSFGTDPFSYTTRDVYWTNHSWLFDLLVYSLMNLGHAALVLFKALLLTVMAFILLDIRRPGQALWLPVFSTGLAVLAMSPYFTMRPVVVSFLFLAATLYLLTRSRRLWLLPPLFVLWVNLDSGFVFGLLTVALYLLGTLLQRLSGQNPEHQAGKLALVLIGCVAACLVNPHFYRVFVLPPELAYLIVGVGEPLPGWMLAAGKTVEVLQGSDPVFAIGWHSPLSSLWLAQAGLGNNVAGWAYFVLLLLVIASFVTVGIGRFREFPWQRFCVWLLFALLSLMQARLIAFFAVVSASILTLNFQDWQARRASVQQTYGDTPTTRRWSGLAPMLTGLALAVLIFLAWPGWLHAPLFSFESQTYRRVAWDLDFDSSLRQTAVRLGELHKKGVIHNGFAFGPEVACYCEWFAPEVKGFLDYRFELFAGQVETFVKTKQLLSDTARGIEPPIAPPGPENTFWQKVAGEFDINYLVVTHFNQSGEPVSVPVAIGCWRDGRRWPWLYGDGRTIVFGWNRSGSESALNQEAISLGKLAFGGKASKALRPGTPESDHTFLENYLRRRGGSTLAADAVSQYFLVNQLLNEVAQRYMAQTYMSTQGWRLLSALATVTSGGMGSVAVPMAPMPPQPTVFESRWAAPILMMREAHHAVAQAPLEPVAYAALERAVDSINDQENFLAGTRAIPAANFRQMLRQIQLLTALKEYLKLKPETPAKHYRLFKLYGEQLHFVDLAVEHLGLAIKYWDKQPAPDAETRKQLQAQKEGLKNLHEKLEAEVKKRLEDFDLRSDRSPLERFRLALSHDPYRQGNITGKANIDYLGLGLARRALAAAQQVKPGQLDDQQKLALAFNESFLRLKMGELPEAGDDPALVKVLGPIYLQFRALRAAAAGDYDQADSALDELIKLMGTDKYLPRLLSDNLIDLAPAAGIGAAATRAYVFALHRSMAASLLQQPAELELVRGLLALERGDAPKASSHFHRVNDLVAAFFPPDGRIAATYLQSCRRMGGDQ